MIHNYSLFTHHCRL